ncbi:hypothetical protein [Lelliottia wanjuensis]|uniref:hypothetical protein n=1 Tax=Lelliottia wanjuensis TaxID=3050585 RepID=UPI00254D9091|nr:hypothetical protein [Lelliottia sp. V104_15]MDK9605691.1 hypothetical protein [Lelliottia sp. V104_15]
MTNTFKSSGVGIILTLISLNGFAAGIWSGKAAHMQCGPAGISVNAECKTDPEDEDSNICKNIIVKISQENNAFSAKLPYMPIEQKKKLEKQGFTFSDIIDTADWAPQKMYCIDDKYILIGYWNGMNDAETIDGSLTFNVSAPIFDLKGEFVDENVSKSLRKKAISSSSDSVDIGFVYESE